MRDRGGRGDVRRRPTRLIAGHGVPNYFRVPGPDASRQARYVARCLRLIERLGAPRASRPGAGSCCTAGVRNRSPHGSTSPAPSRSRTTSTTGRPRSTVGGTEFVSRVRLIGHLDAIDGRYHWQGTVFEHSARHGPGASAGVTLTIEDRTVAARVVEQTPWGTHMIAGVGDPPFIARPMLRPPISPVRPMLPDMWPDMPRFLSTAPVFARTITGTGRHC